MPIAVRPRAIRTLFHRLLGMRRVSSVVGMGRTSIGCVLAEVYCFIVSTV